MKTKRKRTTRVDPVKERKRQGVWKQAFLAAYRKTGIVGTSAQIAGVTRQWVHMTSTRDPEFRQAMDDAREDAADALEQHALDRARDKHKPSDLLTIFMLKGLRPHIYRENHRLEHTGPDGEPIAPVTATTGAVILLPREQFEEEAARYENDGKEKAKEP